MTRRALYGLLAFLDELPPSRERAELRMLVYELLATATWRQVPRVP